jgi:adenosine deaminase
MMNFDHELHIHLFGCLTADDVWTLGKDRWKNCKIHLAWYEDEYEKAWGRRPNSAAYWENYSSGFDALKRDFLFTQHSPFHRFQACFNLMIALFKIKPGEHFVFEHILARHLSLGLRYAEYRTVVPASFTVSELNGHFTAQAAQVLRCESASAGKFTPRIAYSLQRDQVECERQYAILRAWMGANRKLAHAIVGIDFSYFEAGHPPITKKQFFHTVRQDNAADPDLALAILYHVGESFDHLSIESASRWIWEAHVYGAHRLGHGIAIGIDPAARLGVTYHEAACERLMHLDWLLANHGWLHERGYFVDLLSVGNERNALHSCAPGQSVVPTTVTLENIEQIRKFQEVLLADLSRRGAIFESCPTSNFRIGSIIDPKHHPLQQFLAHNCRVCISTDDPGIFDIDLNSEIELCRTQLGIGEDALTRIALASPGMQARAVAQGF